MENALTSLTTTVAELKRDYAEVVSRATDSGEPVAVLNHNKAEAYLVPAALFEKMVEYMEDAEDAKLVESRRGQRAIRVGMDEL
ncbi:type II toxin-antitoxin system Phd/YefM family antitoxin [Chromobacterium sphagni]|uniref:Antitoxin n=1 Tax=Chromobacterium sphagni TaxID=1903179 RepID=A0ABX3CBA4_9NEIS|nr:type II toxin-antitoxin system Phd/YefM family antitoxin [Chromobacterium sphagni]OHX19567.1 prevent-host-death protein [Chromobacterium sphagni]